MNTIKAICNESRIVWSLIGDGGKAAIRTAYQTVQAAAVVAMFAVATSAAAWISGADVDMLDAIALGRTSIGLAAISAIASLKAYYMNRGAKGARYN